MLMVQLLCNAKMMETVNATSTLLEQSAINVWKNTSTFQLVQVSYTFAVFEIRFSKHLHQAVTAMLKVQNPCNVTTMVNANANQVSQGPGVMNACLNSKGTSVKIVPPLSMDIQTAKLVNVMAKDQRTKLAMQKANVLAMTM